MGYASQLGQRHSPSGPSSGTLRPVSMRSIVPSCWTTISSGTQLNTRCVKWMRDPWHAHENLVHHNTSSPLHNNDGDLALSKNPHRSSPSTDRRPAPARSVQRTRMHCNKSISVPSAVHRHSTHSLARPHHPLGGIQSSALFLFFSLQGSGHFRPPCSEINGRAMRSAARLC